MATLLRDKFLLFVCPLLFLTACGLTATDNPKSGLEVQYGTANDDHAVDLATYSDKVYATSTTRLADGRVSAGIRSFARDGSTLWLRANSDNPEYRYTYQNLGVDASGSVYELVMARRIILGGIVEEMHLRKYSGNALRWSRRIDPSGYGGTFFGEMVVTANGVYLFGNYDFPVSSMVRYGSNGSMVSTQELEGGYVRASTFDSNGNIYVVLEGNNPLLQKFAPSGSRLWSRTLPHLDLSRMPNYLDAAVSDSGALYLLSVSEDGQAMVARYSSATGQAVRGWSSTCIPPPAKVSPSQVYGSGLAVSGSSVYVVATATGEGNGSRAVLCKFVSETSPYPYLRLRQAWSRSYGMTTTSSAGVAVDALGNIYVNGSTRDRSGSTNEDVFLQRYTSSGYVNWIR